MVNSTFKATRKSAFVFTKIPNLKQFSHYNHPKKVLNDINLDLINLYTINYFIIKKIVTL